MYGLVTPVFPSRLDAQFDLAHVFAGGRVVFTSDQHFGVGSNLILPGRGMSALLLQSLIVTLSAIRQRHGGRLGD